VIIGDHGVFRCKGCGGPNDVDGGRVLCENRYAIVCQVMMG